MRAAFREQQRPQSLLVNDSPRRQPRSMRELSRELNEQLLTKLLHLARIREKRSASAAAAQKLRSRIRELERQIQQHHDRLTLLRSGRFSLMLALPFWIILRVLQERWWHSRQELDELLAEQQTLTTAIRRLEDECRHLEVRLVQLQAHLRCAPASNKTAYTRSQRRQRPHHS